MIDEILVEDGKVIGVRTATHQEYGAKAVIVTTGTALRGESSLGISSIHQALTIALLLSIWLKISRILD